MSSKWQYTDNVSSINLWFIFFLTWSWMHIKINCVLFSLNFNYFDWVSVSFLHLATRVMILTAVKEMNGKKGVSILSIYKYVSSIYRYDVQRNRSLLKRMLKCLIFEGLVKQIKGHGFSGTFTLGKNYKEEDIYDKTKKQVTEHLLSSYIWYLTEWVDSSHLDPEALTVRR